MQRLEVSGAVRPIYGSLGVKRLITAIRNNSLLIASVSDPSVAAHWRRTLATKALQITDGSPL